MISHARRVGFEGGDEIGLAPRGGLLRSGAVLADHIVSFAEIASRTAAHQAILCRKRCAARRLLARACHSATALTLIRPRTGMNPKPWFLR